MVFLPLSSLFGSSRWKDGCKSFACVGVAHIPWTANQGARKVYFSNTNLWTFQSTSSQIFWKLCNGKIRYVCLARKINPMLARFAFCSSLESLSGSLEHGVGNHRVCATSMWSVHLSHLVFSSLFFSRARTHTHNHACALSNKLCKWIVLMAVWAGGGVNNTWRVICQTGLGRLLASGRLEGGHALTRTIFMLTPLRI